MLNRDVRVIVVGAGIGGLATAIALRDVGLQVQVLEKSAELRPIGAGLLLHPNAMLALRALGLEDAADSAGVTIRRTIVRTPSGDTLFEQDTRRLGRSLGATTVAIHRGQLHRLLLEKFRGTEIKTNTFISEIRENGSGVEAILDDGSSVSADALIGADGLHSQVREHLWGQQRLRPAGYTCWRGVVAHAEIAASDVVGATWGAGRRFGWLPIGDGKVYWFATTRTDAGTSAQHVEDSREFLLGEFGDWHPPIPRLIAETSSILKHEASDLLLESGWGRGRMTLLGDAAHAMTPNLAQGAAQALEDALRCASSARHAESIEHWLRDYEQSRRRRTREMLLASRRVGQIAQGNTLLARCLRDHLLARLPSAVLDWRVSRLLGHGVSSADAGLTENDLACGDRSPLGSTRSDAGRPLPVRGHR